MKAAAAAAAVALLLCATAGAAVAQSPPPSTKVPITDNFTDYELFQLALNLEYLEAEFYLFSAYGYGLDKLAPSLTGGGPPPIGGQKAVLSPDVEAIAQMLGLQEIGHIRIIRQFLGNKAFPRPLINIGSVWETIGKDALLPATFNPYVGDVPWLLAAFNIPYVGLTGYVGSNDYLTSRTAKHLLAGVLGVEGGQDAMLRTLLWSIRDSTISPYGLAVKNITGLLTHLGNILNGPDAPGIVMENIVVPPSQGAEGKTSTNILSANGSSVSYQRTPGQVLATVYGSKDPFVPGGFFPKGANGAIARSYLNPA